MGFIHVKFAFIARHVESYVYVVKVRSTCRELCTSCEGQLDMQRVMYKL